MKSIKQIFGIFIVALALFGAYSLVCPKKPVDDNVSDEFRAELASEGIFLNEDEDFGGKSVLFNTLGNFPALPTSAQTAPGQPSSSLPPSLLGGGSSSAPKYGQPSDDDLDLHIPSDFSDDDAPAWNENWGENSTPTLQNAPEVFDLPVLEVPSFDEAPAWNDNLIQTPQNAPETFDFPLLEVPSFEEPPLFDVPSTELKELALTPMISEDSLNSWNLIDAAPGETLNGSVAFTPIDSTAAFVPSFIEVPQESDQTSFGWNDSVVTYDQRAPTNPIANPRGAQPSDGSVRPLPTVTVTEGAVMTLASGAAPNASPTITSLPATGFEELPPPISDYGDFSDFSTTPAPEVPSNIPGIARSSPRREAPDPAYASMQDSPFQAKNPISQSTPRPEVMQRLSLIKDILNDERQEYRLGHQMVTELYMSDLNFAERELVFQVANKCGWAAFFSSRTFDPYDWGQTIRPTDTIQSLAAQNGISPEMILKINLLEHPSQLTPGRENVKIPKGPFDATIFLDRKEMVITARGLFACCFRIGIGSPEIITEGVYKIESKFPKPRYLGELGEIDSGDPRNPLGTHWIGLDQEIGIHGTNTPSCLGTDNAPVEGFSLDNRDVAEAYDMLTSESRITVKR